MNLRRLAPLLGFALHASAVRPIVRTTTGPIVGVEVSPGVLAWKGIPFAVPPTGLRRWTAPELNYWNEPRNTTALGPACIQDLQPGDLAQLFYNNPPLPEDEDCLTINVWAPSATTSSTESPKAVLFWIFGGGFQFGGSGTFFYDGTSFVKNQDVIIVSHNYRTNIFGFPNSPKNEIQEQNLGLLDQQLALSWTRDNIAKFGGDPNKITLFGQSAGSGGVALLVERYPENPPFHAAILQSGVRVSIETAPPEDLTAWKSVSAHFMCPSNDTIDQINCLKKVPAGDIKQFIIDNNFGFLLQADGGITVPNQPRQKLESGAVAQVPVMIGDNAQGGSFLTIGQDNFTAFISQPPFNAIPPAQLRALYPVPEKFSSDALAIIALQTDVQYRCPSATFSNIFTNRSQPPPPPVYRYVYGAVFPEFQLFPNAGTVEGTELPLVFGNLNDPRNATEQTLSKTLQTIWANFAKDPGQPPAPGWSSYSSNSRGIASLAFGSNVAIEDVVNMTTSSSFDRACQLLDTLRS